MKNYELKNQAYKNIFPNAELLLQLSLKRIDEIKDDCLFVLDTNVLLTPYKTGKESLLEIKKLYSSLIQADRLFVPGQVIREFAVNRPEKIKELFSSFQKKHDAGENYYLDNYPLLEGNNTFDELKIQQNNLKEMVKNHKMLLKKLLDEIRDWNWNDPVSQLYQELFSKNVIYDPDLTDEEIKWQLEFRNNNKIPPGYKDNSKEINREGDLIVWLTILKLVENKQNHVIFISHDSKNDWFHKSENQALYPRYELQYEFQLTNPGKSFFIIQLSEFMKIFNVNDKVIQEIEETEFVNSLNEFERKIWYAIKNQRLVSFNYNGMYRIVEPYCFGITTAGSKGLRAYQIDGYSASGQLGWKLFNLENASSIQILDETFDGPRDGYKKGDRGMSHIYCEL